MHDITPAEKLAIRKLLWKNATIHWKLHDVQKEIYDSIAALPVDVREVLVFCSRRLGKSYLGLVMAIESCLKNPGKQIAIVGPNLKQTRKILVPLIAQITADAPAGIIKETKSELQWRIGDATLLIQAFDSALESLRGLELFEIYLEESGLASVDKYNYILYSILFPTLMHSKGRVIHLTTPAVDTAHPLHTETMPKCQANGAYFKYTIRDNPLLSPEDIAEEIDNMGGIESVAVQRELFCQILRDETTSVVPEFDDTLHVAEFELPKHYIPLTAGDWGGVKDKTVILQMCFDYEKNKILVYDERAFDNQTATREIVQVSLEMEKQWGNVPDIRRIDTPGQLRIDLANEYNFSCLPPHKKTFDESIAELRLPFYHNQILIHPRCKLLIATLTSATFNKNRTDFARTKALGHADAIMALTYGVRHISKLNPVPKKLRDSDTYVRQEDNNHALLQLF